MGATLIHLHKNDGLRPEFPFDTVFNISLSTVEIIENTTTINRDGNDCGERVVDS